MNSLEHRAIQTRYAGCHFRSRLEARWAVFFDTLGIKWEYEAQGYECFWRLDMHYDDTFRWLPDFYLPELNQLVEVKGTWDTQECWRFLNAFASLGTCHGDGDGYSVVVAGPIPSPSDAWSPWTLHFHKGELIAEPWVRLNSEETERIHHGQHVSPTHLGSGCNHGPCVADDSGSFNDGNSWTRELLDGECTEITFVHYPFVPAMRAARSARFEHGQVGAT